MSPRHLRRTVLRLTIMEPQIRYAKTSDGVNIAYWSIGSGVPVVMMDMPCSNIRYEWEHPAIRTGYQATARVATFVRFDHRTFGLSDHYDGPLSTDLFVEDLGAVVDKLGFHRFFLIAARGPTYPIGLHFAERYPGRIIRLAAMIGGPPQGFVEALLDTPGADWRFMTEAVSRTLLGWDDEEASRNLAEFIRASTDMERMREWMKWSADARPPDDMSDIDVPTMFLVAADDSLATARKMASDMPNARIEFLGWATGTQANNFNFGNAVSRFFGGAELTAADDPPPVPSGTAIILFADIADSTALTERLGDAGFRGKARALDAGLRAVVHDHGGTAIDGKLLGDGILATFPAASQGIAAALSYEEAAQAVGLGLHVGLHAGDVIRESNNVYGGAVNIAARISALAPPGEVLVSRTVADLARTSAGVTFENRGEHGLKGVGESVQVFAVRRQE